MSNLKLFAIMLVGVLGVGCTKVSHHEGIKNEVGDSLTESIVDNKKVKPKNLKGKLPSSVANLMRVQFGSNCGIKKGGAAIEPKFDVVVDHVDVQDFFLGLIKDTNYNVILDKSVNGFISLNLKGVTVPQVMEAVRDSYGYDYKLTGYGYYVYGRKLISKIYHVNYINLSRKGVTLMDGISSSQLVDEVSTDSQSSSSVKRASNVAISTIQQEKPFWLVLEENLKLMIGGANYKNARQDDDSRAVVVNANTNTVVVRAYPEELRLVDQYLKEVQEVIQRQVIIEAKIVEVELKDQFKTGINWEERFGKNVSMVDSKGVEHSDKTVGFFQQGVSAFGDAVGGNTASGVFRGIFGSFATTLQVLNGYGSINVLSNPRITTLNNQKAIIKIGEESFFTVGLTDDTTTSSGGIDRRSTVKLQVFFSGISLDVIPQIDDGDNITLHLHPTVCDVTENRLRVTSGDKASDIPTAKSRIKESDSVVRAKSGEVIVIGGLMETYSKVFKDGLPLVEKIPLIGEATKSRDQSARKYEMVILLKPTIVKKTEDWNRELESISKRIQIINKNRFSYDFENPTNKKHVKKVKKECT